jgi:ER membrane protein complex subunit 3
MSSSTQSLFLDPALRDWVLIPIFIVMIMVGILRHYATLLLQSPPRPEPLKAVREQSSLRIPVLMCRRALLRAQLLRNNAHHIPRSAFENRKRFLQAAFEKGEYLKDPENRGAPPPNPLTDPSGMDSMMNMMKSNMVMFIPQTVIMAWINFFFSGFVLRSLPRESTDDESTYPFH